MYYLAKPLDDGLVQIEKIFSSDDEAMLWFEENKHNPEYIGWSVLTEDDLSKLN